MTDISVRERVAPRRHSRKLQPLRKVRATIWLEKTGDLHTPWRVDATELELYASSVHVQRSDAVADAATIAAAESKKDDGLVLVRWRDPEEHAHGWGSQGALQGEA